MEPLSMVRTILGIVQDIVSAAETASRNKSRCKKVATRVLCIKDILEALENGTTDAATRSMMDRLKEALSGALRVVRQCQSSSLLRSVIVNGGGMADPLDCVEAEIDRCILDLNFANSLRIARLEKLVRQHSMADSTQDTEKDENKRKKGSAAESISDKKRVDQVPISSFLRSAHDNTTETEETAAAIGFPVYTVAAAVEEHKHEMVSVPPPSYWNGYGYRSNYGYWPNHGYACNCWDENADGAGPSDAASYYPNPSQYSTSPSMFSDEDPNSCTIL